MSFDILSLRASRGRAGRRNDKYALHMESACIPSQMHRKSRTGGQSGSRDEARRRYYGGIVLTAERLTRNVFGTPGIFRADPERSGSASLEAVLELPRMDKADAVSGEPNVRCSDRRGNSFLGAKEIQDPRSTQ